MPLSTLGNTIFEDDNEPLLGDQGNMCLEMATINHMINTLYLYQAIINPVKPHTKHNSGSVGSHNHSEQNSGSVGSHNHSEQDPGSVGSHNHSEQSSGSVGPHNHTSSAVHAGSHEVAGKGHPPDQIPLSELLSLDGSTAVSDLGGGLHKVMYSDETVAYAYSDGNISMTLPDGTSVVVYPDGGAHVTTKGGSNYVGSVTHPVAPEVPRMPTPE